MMTCRKMLLQVIQIRFSAQQLPVQCLNHLELLSLFWIVEIIKPIGAPTQTHGRWSEASLDISQATLLRTDDV